MPQAYSYIRFSSEKQELGDSLRRQLKLAVDYATEHGLDLDTHSYRDLGISAFKGKNAQAALGGFLQAVDSGLIQKGSTLLVENLDRLSRQQVDEALELFLSIIRRGITIVTLQDKQVYSSERIKQDKGISLIISITYMMRAHEESATKSKRVKEAWAAKREKKEVTANCPFWLRPNDARTKYVQIADKVKIVRKIFKLAAEGKGIYLIQQELHETGVPYYSTSKDGWTVQNVGRILHQQAVIGRLVSVKNNQVIDDYYPAIIEKDVFYAIQEKIEERKSAGAGRKGDGIANLFSGLIRCGDCGSPMRFVKTPSGGHFNTYLECNDALYKKKHPPRKLNYHHIEKRVLAELLVFQGIEAKPIESEIDPSVAIRGEIADKKQQVEKLNRLIEQSDERTARNLLGRLSRFLEEEERLEQALRDVVQPKRRAATIAASVRDALELYHRHETKDMSEKELTELRMKLQSAIKSFVSEISLPSTVIENYDKDGKTKYRVAKVKLRGTNIKRLKKPSTEVLLKHAPDAPYDALDAPIEEHGSDDVINVYYQVPAKGNGGNVGERSRAYKASLGLPLPKVRSGKKVKA